MIKGHDKKTDMIFRYAIGKIADYQEQELTFSFDQATPGGIFLYH